MQRLQSFPLEYKLQRFHEPDKGQTANGLLDRNPEDNRTKSCDISEDCSHQWRWAKELDREVEQGSRLSSQVFFQSSCSHEPCAKTRILYFESREYRGQDKSSQVEHGSRRIRISIHTVRRVAHRAGPLLVVIEDEEWPPVGHQVDVSETGRTESQSMQR